MPRAFGKVPLAPFSSESLEGAGIVIDAIFGAGLSRPLDGKALAMVEALKSTPDTGLRGRCSQRT